MMIWNGPSLIDGAPIVLLATWQTRNRKTGDMIQTWILRTDRSPAGAVSDGSDRSVCGDCPQRHYLGGACYVLPFQAPGSIYRAWRAGSYRGIYHARAWHRARTSIPIRIGAYGDPAAVPARIWQTLVDGAIGHTGYTHQWRAPYAQDLRGIVMASVDSVAEAREAEAAGWRYFRAAPSAGSEPGLGREIECLSETAGRSCADCRLCNGARTDASRQPVSIRIALHGARAPRLLPVVRS